VVTGASSGIGLVTARCLAAVGARVVVAVRDVGRGERAAATMAGEPEVRALDLADLDSVRAFAAGWSGPLHLLINNAGSAAAGLQRTRQGFESQFGVNHLGHFALTNLLLEHVTGRVVTVSSVTHRYGHIDFDDLDWERRRYWGWAAYAQSKLANLLFTLELQRRLDADGSTVLATAAHPGFARTGLLTHSPWRLAGATMALGSRLLAQSDERGALPTLYAATQALPGAAFIGPTGTHGLRGGPGPAPRAPAAFDADLAARLWTVSEQLTGVAYRNPAATT
jgi:NAD(P)-dependent dehydrogenase (short-subunit alcohol dehydrogenase family)